MDSMNSDNLERYNVINEKNKREIVLLRGRGCVWKKCTFCDYHEDFSSNDDNNYQLNKNVLSNVTGVYNQLEIINSGSFSELDNNTVDLILDTCIKNNIKEISVELHWIFRKDIEKIRKKFYPIKVNIKIGIETFDINFRENILKKGMGNVTAYDIKQYFQDCCLLIGIKGQTKEQILDDISIASNNFNRVCINIFNENNTNCKRDNNLVNWFVNELYDTIKNDSKFDILISNTDFGVG